MRIEISFSKNASSRLVEEVQNRFLDNFKDCESFAEEKPKGFLGQQWNKYLVKTEADIVIDMTDCDREDCDAAFDALSQKLSKLCVAGTNEPLALVEVFPKIPVEVILKPQIALIDHTVDEVFEKIGDYKKALRKEVESHAGSLSFYLLGLCSGKAEFSKKSDAESFKIKILPFLYNQRNWSNFASIDGQALDI